MNWHFPGGTSVDLGAGGDVREEKMSVIIDDFGVDVKED